MKFTVLLTAILFFSTWSAYGQIFDCSFEAISCTKSDKTSFTCEQKSELLQTKLELACPDRKNVDLYLKEFGYNKNIQMSAICGQEQSLALVVYEKLNPTVGRTIGFTVTSATAPAIKLLTGIYQDIGSSDNRVTFIIECYQKTP